MSSKQHKPDTTPIPVASPISQLLVCCINCRIEAIGREMREMTNTDTYTKEREIRKLNIFLESQGVLDIPSGQKIQIGKLIQEHSEGVSWMYLFEWKLPPIEILRSLNLEHLGITIVPIASALGKALIEKGSSSLVSVHTQPEAKAIIQDKFNPKKDGAPGPAATSNLSLEGQQNRATAAPQ